MFSRTLPLSLLALLFAWGCDSGAIEAEELPGPDAFDVVPQVEMAGFTTAYISWSSADTSANAVVRIGRSRDVLDGNVPAGQDDSLSVAVAEGLESDTEYYFSVSLIRDGDEVGRSDTVSFRTRPLLPQASDLGVAFQQEVVGRLTGHIPVRDTLRLRTRSDSVSRRRAAEYLRDGLTSLGLEGEFHEYHGTYVDGDGVVQSEWWGQNVFATLPATSPTDEWVVIGSHYDSVQGSPGAIDNATGVAITLAVAGQLAQLGRLSQNVVVALFDQEERGLLGSGAFAERMASAGDSVRSMHNFEMTGWDGDGDRALDFGTRTSPRRVRLAYRLAAREMAPDVTLNEMFDVGRSDHRRFANSLVLSEEFSSGDRTPYYHGPGDTYDTVDFDYLLSTTRVATTAVVLLLTGETLSSGS